MKKYLLILLTFLPAKVFCIDAVVTVLHAPLFERPSTESKIVDYIKKGEILDIHQKDVFKSDLTQLTEDLAAEMHILDQGLPPGKFYRLFDRRGRQVYVLKKHVKVFTEDSREITAKINPHDATDYRLQEPLPENYPYYTPKHYRTFFSFGVGQNNKTSYPYTAAIIDQGFSPNYQMDFYFAKKVDFDQSDRLYFGLMLSFSQSSKEFIQEFRFDITASENWMTFGFGPVLSYDAWKGQKDIFTIYFATLYHPLFQNQVEQIYPTGMGFNVEDSRTFNAMTITPRLGGHFTWGDSFFAGTNLIFGASAQIHFPVKMRTQSEAVDPEIWSARDVYNLRPEVEVNMYFGIERSI